MIRLDIFSDPVCPWCYIGKANLDRALEARGDHPFEIEWHPFQLNPDMAPGGMDRATYLADKFGGTARVAQMEERIEAVAREAGLTIDFANITRIPNTLDAHRLIHWAGLEGRQTPMKSALMRAYWRDGRDIGDAVTLADIAGETGLDRTAMARLLATDADRDSIMARDAHARERGVNAVPTFLIANQYVLSGAQPAEFWGRVMAELEGSRQ
jgi:predicted DsbA family dithiol-disulfide isomerase